MKKLFTILTTILFTTSIYSQQVSFCEDFESYSVGLTGGDPIAETSSHWNSWDELMNGTTAPFTDDAQVTNIIASSGTNSLYFLGTGASGGPQDILLMFDTTSNITQANLSSLSTPYVSGNVVFSQMMNIRSGAYLNFQAENTPGVQWAVEVNFDLDPINPTDPGTITMSNTNGTSFSAQHSFSPMQWFEFKFDIDLSNNVWELFIDGVSQGSFNNSINKIASLDLYTRAGDEYTVDDVCYSYTPATLDPINLQTYSILPIDGLVGQQRNPSVEVRNFGLNTINSFDITFDYNGSQITENVNNINLGFGLTSLQAMTIDFTNTITLSAAATTATAYIYNINNNTPQSTSDDTLTLTINAVTPAYGKLVLGEEATGTWCGWCPRGAVALNWMEHDYDGYWQGIAIHNGQNDPMVNGPYDSELGGYISGYPSGLVDRGPDIDPSDFKQDFMQRIVVPPAGIITNGAELNGNNLKVSLTIDFLSAVSGSYKLACAIVEDSVTGSGPGWYQANSYSGGSSLIDVDGQDWNQLPGNVPDYMMMYRHVARGIAPTFNGETLPNTTYAAGDTETLCYEFTLDPSWDQSKIHIVGILLDNNNTVDNASSSGMNEAILHGYVPCATSSTAIELNGPDRVNVYPNPATEKVYISNLREENVTTKIYDVKGGLVLEKKVSNKQEINISTLSKGVYQIKFEGSDWSESRKIIVE